MDMLKQFSIMCNHIQKSETKCKECPMRAEIDTEQTTCLAFITAQPDRASTIIQEWFFSYYHAVDLIDRTALLQEFHARWVNSNRAREDLLLYLDIEELIKAQPKVLPPEQVSTGTLHGTDSQTIPTGTSLAKDVQTFAQDYLSHYPHALSQEGIPRVNACWVYGELEQCRRACRTGDCSNCWTTPMYASCIERRRQELIQGKE